MPSARWSAPTGRFRRNISDYPNLNRHLRELYELPGIAGTVDFSHIKRHYYVTHDDINPSGIVPVGPAEFFRGDGRVGEIPG